MVKENIAGHEEAEAKMMFKTLDQSHAVMEQAVMFQEKQIQDELDQHLAPPPTLKQQYVSIL